MACRCSICRCCSGHRSFQLGAICGARRLRARAAYCRAERQLRSLEQWRAAAAKQRLQLRQLRQFPDRQSRLARRDHACAAGPKRRCSRARMRARSSPSSPPTSRDGNGWARLADAYAASGRMAEALDAARGRRGHRPTSARTDEQAIWARYGGSFTARRQRRARRCSRCSRRSRTTQPDSSSSTSPDAAGGLRRAHRDAAERLRCRQPLPGRDRQRDERCRTDDGPRALPSREQLRTRPRSSLPRAPTISSTRPPTPSASSTCS